MTPDICSLGPYNDDTGRSSHYGKPWPCRWRLFGHYISLPSAVTWAMMIGLLIMLTPDNDFGVFFSLDQILVLPQCVFLVRNSHSIAALMPTPLLKYWRDCRMMARQRIYGVWVRLYMKMRGVGHCGAVWAMRLYSYPFEDMDMKTPRT